ncbi:hypothetical protein [Merismopedia glauca]|uniref:Uncharacterized protein n=1 Tax=Merismopedia glauca CCAP 1448/3 TaxID=1296344 RepID=A0A2T1C274_9CYAN|nr:hypothetical protein [Merismopedia glauca]PSB02376.1 hypothetical protein C7B64_13400 [Merismopedia glauca CCAP 1448/3]
MKNVKFNTPVVIGIGFVTVLATALAIKSNADHQAQVKREMAEYQIKRLQLQAQFQLREQARIDEEKARAFSRIAPSEEQRWLKVYCANPKSHPEYTNLYKYSAELKAKQLGQPVPTTEEVIADECASVSSSSPSPTVSIDSVSPSPTP